MNFKNYKVAATIMIIMVVVAIFLGGFRAVVKMNDEVDTIYVQQLQPELNRQAERAGQLVALAKLEKMDTELIHTLENDLSIFNEAESKNEKYHAFTELQNSFTLLKLSMVDHMSTSENERYLNQIYQNFYSAYDLIMHARDNYNEDVENLNSALNQFPVSIIKIFVGRGHAELFA